MPPSLDPTDSPPRRSGWDDVTIGIVTALSVESVAVKSFIEHREPVSVAEDPNEYHVGYLDSSDRARPHRVALVTMPEDNTRYAAATCTEMLRTFRGIRCVLMIGVAGGIPSLKRPDRHVRLGDVVVAVEGVVDYGHVRVVDGVDALRRPVEGICVDLLRAVKELQQRELEGRPLPWSRPAPAPERPLATFGRPAADTDKLMVGTRLVEHPARSLTGHRPGRPKVHYGMVGSGDMLMRDEQRRDELAERYGILAVEMEGSGIAASARLRGVQWFMVRGISDYCNKQKNDRWHPYASLMAASYTQTLLSLCRPFPAWAAAPRSGVLALMSNPERDDIIRLLSHVPDLDPRDLWHAAAGALAQLPAQPLDSIGEVFDHLSELNADDGLPPAVALLEEAAVRTVDPHARLLRYRADVLADRLGASEALMRRRVERPAESPSSEDARPCLVVQIIPDGIDARRCVTSCWVQYRSGPWHPEPGGEAAEAFLDALEPVLEQFVRDAERAWRRSRDPVAIEFLLPVELLNTPTEWWSTDLDSAVPTPLCADYEVVLRSLDRMRAEYHHRRWMARWQAMWQTTGEHRVLWAEEAGGDLTEWANRLKFDGETCVVVLSAAPDSDAGRQELGLALAAGVAVIIWDRRGSIDAGDAPTIRQLAGGHPGRLLQALRQLRTQAATGSRAAVDMHLGRNLAVLWDDPNRLIELGGAGQ